MECAAEVNIARHLADFGVEEEFGNHAHIRGLSGGQKVKVVLAACTWLSPHIVILVSLPILSCISNAYTVFRPFQSMPCCIGSQLQHIPQLPSKTSSLSLAAFHMRSSRGWSLATCEPNRRGSVEKWERLLS